MPRGISGRTILLPALASTQEACRHCTGTVYWVTINKVGARWASHQTSRSGNRNLRRVLLRMKPRRLIHRQQQPIRPLEVLHRLLAPQVQAIHVLRTQAPRFGRGDHPLQLALDSIQLEGDVAGIPELAFPRGFEFGYRVPPEVAEDDLFQQGLRGVSEVWLEGLVAFMDRWGEVRREGCEVRGARSRWVQAEDRRHVHSRSRRPACRGCTVPSGSHAGW
jgi:hypothetical protein